MISSSKKVAVCVPGSTSNLGPGFDCLGLALQIYNRVEVWLSEGSEESDLFLQEAASAFFRASGLSPCGFGCSICGDVPRSRGLGSSVTVRVGLIHGLNELFGEPLSREQIFLVCKELEGHPDNAAPASFGGFAVCRADGAWQRFDVGPRLRFILAIPGLEYPTAEARKAVPQEFSRQDAVWNLTHTASVVAAMVSGNYECLRGAFDDRFHQPYRGKHLPFLEPAIRAGVGAGALGGWLSGSGSTIACVALEREDAIAEAMAGSIREITGGVCETRILSADNTGVRILRD